VNELFKNEKDGSRNDALWTIAISAMIEAKL
jgi:hypothetical protein